MNIVAIADLQGQCQSISPTMLPPGDMLICAGDLTNNGDIRELAVFNAWLGTLPYKHKIVVAGNHDLMLNRGLDGHSIITNAIYLQDEMVVVDGYTVWGTPASNCGPYARYWEFCSPSYVERAYSLIPDSVDIIISHGPAYGILDKTTPGDTVGSRALREALDRIKPQLLIHGHIHEAYGTALYGDRTTIVNAALCDEWNNLVVCKDEINRLVHDPISINIISNSCTRI